MRTVKLLIAFDGSGYCGWQRQKNGPTIQAEIEQALSVICNHHIALHGAGRTDAGVHAEGMSAHFTTSSAVTVGDLLRGLNSLLPDAIRILEVTDRERNFHARFSARGKTYRYTIFTGPVMPPCRRLYVHHVPADLDFTSIRKCLDFLVGTHDFSSFEATGSRDRENENGRGAVRTMYRTELNQYADSYVDLLFTGDGFLRHMVRNLTGTIIEVGKGKRNVEEFKRIFVYRDRSQAGTTAPACGLSLITVHYSKAW